MAALQTVTEQDFEREVLMSEVPVLLEFGAEWCGPCKTVAPELEAIAQELSGKAKVVTVDIDKSPLIAQQMGVQSVPTFVVFHEGRPIDGKVGVLRRQQLREMLEPVLPRAQGALKPAELAALLQQGKVTPVDTREAAVYGRVHLPGAINMPLDGIEGRLAELHMLPSPAVLYCRTGEQTKEMAEKLAQAGVPVAFLEGGVLAWEAEGFEIERPD
jgi:thioredoxin 1/putative thioredoxin